MALTVIRLLCFLLVPGLFVGETAQAQEPAVSPHGAFTIDVDCAACHRTDAWTPLREEIAFDHNQQTRFPLTGSHALADCATCHLDLRFDAPEVEANDCAGCHVDVHLGTFTGRCVDCHNTTLFTEVDGLEIHNRTRFPLSGAHAQIACESCHRTDEGGAFSLLDTDCFSCHEPDFSVAHSTAGFPTTCATCHNTLAWATTSPFDHTALSGGFALLGAHKPLDCTACHRDVPGFPSLFQPTGPDDCLTCHQTDYEQQHGSSGFPTACLDCHTVDTWDDAVFDHAALGNGFALLGAHEALECSACHGPPPALDPLFIPADQNDCAACHQPDYDGAHAGTGFPTTCMDCHGTDTWDDVGFDHATAASGFGLVGAHDALPCSACHAPPPSFDPLYTPLSQDDCVTCHQADYDDEHVGSGFPTTCLDCHNTTDWDDATFSHAAVADGFQLLGAHEALDCAQCHAPPPDFSPLFNPTGDADCVACHQPDYDQEHSGSGFPTACLACHTVETWDDAVFDHGSVANGFGLVGAHDALECSACHAPPPDFSPLFSPVDQNDCVTCHQPDYDGAHAGTGFPTTCPDCHGTTTWEDATFEHASVASGFRLLGAHEQLPCAACHAPPPSFDPLFTPTDDSDCIACHQPEFDQEHSGSGFPTACLDCHGTDTWDDAVFDHASVGNGFQLVGAHEVLECSACHAPPPDFSPLYNPSGQDDCVACHQADYDQEHAGSGFPTTCLDCHNTTDWDDADFDHTGFPIFSGNHAGEWDSCGTCHTSPGDFSVFTCLVCHEHRQAEMDSKHDDVSGYVYESNACYSCHPRGDD